MNGWLVVIVGYFLFLFLFLFSFLTSIPPYERSCVVWVGLCMLTSLLLPHLASNNYSTYSTLLYRVSHRNHRVAYRLLTKVSLTMIPLECYVMSD
jgi:hypothetical protein